MSYDHIRAVAKRFNGTLAERMVLTAFAVHADPKTGISTVSIQGIAAFTHQSRSNVRRIVRRLEGAQDAPMAEPGKWLYPQGKQAMQGDVTATCYRMFLDSQTSATKRPPRNPEGFNRRGGRGLSNRGDGEGSSNRPPLSNPMDSAGGGVPVTGGMGRVPVTDHPVTQTSDPGYPNIQTPVTVTHKSIESLSESRLQPEGPEVRQSQPTATPLDDWIQSGASPQTPERHAWDGDPIGFGKRSPALPEATDDETDLVLINDHQPPLDPIP